MSSGLDGILGGLVGKLGDSGALGDIVGGLAPEVVGLLQGGGLNKLLAQFNAAGLGGEADSWVGTGDNEPITADNVKQALSEEQIAGVAKRLGVSNEQAAAALAEVLPEAVNHLTPDGHVPDQAQVDHALQAAQAPPAQ